MTVAILSGGMDSTTLVAWLLEQNEDVTALGFDYGQRHRRELASAGQIAAHYGVPYHLVSLSDLRNVLTGSALTDDRVDVPDGHYAEDSMKQTVVPNRNAIMLSIAYGHAIAEGHKSIAFGAHAGDHFIYPDCRPGFVHTLQEALNTGMDGFGHVDIRGPFLHMTKTDICRLGGSIGVPYALTWSCYKGNDVHCGTCGTCTERKEAFADSGVEDPTVYAA